MYANPSARSVLNPPAARCRGFRLGLALAAVLTAAGAGRAAAYDVYAGTQGGFDAQGKVYQYQGGTSWLDLNPSQDIGHAVMSLVMFQGRLHAGTQTDMGFRGAGGVGQVWRHEGGGVWTLLGSLDQSVAEVVVLDGRLYAATSATRLYRFEGQPGQWTLAAATGGSGFRAAYVSRIRTGADEIYLGDWFADVFWRYNEADGIRLVSNLGGSCIWGFAEYNNRLYAGAWHGPVYVSDNGSSFRLLTRIGNDHVWDVVEFRGLLYLGSGFGGDQPQLGRLRTYDDVTQAMNVVHSWPSADGDEGVISLATDRNDDLLFIGIGVPDGYSPGPAGTGEVWTFDGSAYSRICDPDFFGGGVQTLLVVDDVAPSLSCSAGGPYASQCRSAIVDGAAVNGPATSLSFQWSSSEPAVSLLPSGGSIPAGSGIRPLDPSTVTLLSTVAPCGVSATLTLDVDDGQGSTTSCAATVTFADDQPPTLGPVPADQAAACNAVPPAATPTGSDNCDPPAVTLVEARTDGTCPDRYTLARTWTATDVCGNAVSATQRIAVDDTVAPLLQGVPPDARAACDAVPPPAAPAANDLCDPAPGIAFAESRTDGSCPDRYALTRTWTATDRCGNAASAVQVVTVDDAVPPVLVGVPADAVAECDAVPPAASPTASDGCDPAPAVAFAGSRIDGDCPDRYTLVRTWTATDRCGNATIAAQRVTVVDTTAPVPVAVLLPLAPRPPLSAHSVCSAPLSRTFQVRCSATDSCDPAPDLAAVLEVARTEVAGGACLARIERVAVACDETIEIRLVAPPCPARSPRSPQPVLGVNSAGVRTVTGEAVRLVVTATDRCGNAAAATFNPAAAPSPLCDDRTTAGACCAAVGAPAPGPCRVVPCERPGWP